MNKLQTNQFRMFLSTQSYLDNNTTIWNGIPRIVSYKNNLDEIIARISQKSEQAKLSIGVTQQKDSLKEIIATKAAMLAGVIHVFALEQNNIDMALSVKTNKSDIMRLKEPDVDATVRKITTLAADHIETLGEFGLSQDIVTELLSSLNDFNALIGKPRTILSQKYATLGTIDDLFAECNQLLKPMMDNTMLIFKDSQAEFYKGYQNARNIIDN